MDGFLIASRSKHHGPPSCCFVLSAARQIVTGSRRWPDAAVRVQNLDLAWRTATYDCHAAFVERRDRFGRPTFECELADIVGVLCRARDAVARAERTVEDVTGEARACGSEPLELLHGSRTVADRGALTAAFLASRGDADRATASAAAAALALFEEYVAFVRGRGYPDAVSFAGFARSLRESAAALRDIGGLAFQALETPNPKTAVVQNGPAEQSD